MATSLCIRFDADPASSAHVRVETGDGWARAVLYCGPGGGDGWAPLAATAADLLRGLFGAEEAARVFVAATFEAGGGGAATHRGLSAWQQASAGKVARAAAQPAAPVGPAPVAAGPDPQIDLVVARVKAYVEQYGSHPDFRGTDPATCRKVHNYISSVYGSPLPAGTLGAVRCRLAAEDL